jgi:hypothetical protein
MLDPGITKKITVSSINCNSLNSSVASKNNRNLKVHGKTKLSTDIVFLCDLRLSNRQLVSSENEIRKAFQLNMYDGYDCFFNSTKNKRGVGIHINKKISYAVLGREDDPEVNFILLHIDLAGENLVIASVYGPNSMDLTFFTKLKAGLRSMSPNNAVPVIVGGDWNCTYSADPVNVNIDVINMIDLPNKRHSEAVIGRVYTVHPTSNAECYFLLMLLHSVVGPSSFQDLKTVDGFVCETYREACEKRGLLEHDQHWENTMAEASESQMPKSLRHLFCIILTTCKVSNPLALWEKCKKELSADILHHIKVKQENSESSELSTEAEYKTLLLLEDICLAMNGKLLPELGIPLENHNSTKALSAMLYRETHYNKEELKFDIDQKEPMLLPEQRLIYKEILQSVLENQEAIFFIDAPGGTGKTFLLNLLLSKVRKDVGIALAVASSGSNFVRYY